MTDFRARQQQIAYVLADSGRDAFLVTHMPNARYLCGFTGSSGLLVVGPRRRTLITDGRYTGQARQEVQGANVVIAKVAALAAAAALLSDNRHSALRVAIEAEHMTVAVRSRLRKLLPKKTSIQDLSSVVERARMKKDAQELKLVRNAVVLGAKLLDTAVAAIRPGVAEAAVAAELEYAARRAGAQEMSFPTIVAAGPHSAMPHWRASARPIPRRGFVVLDFGVILAGYCSDMTRTVHVGKPTAEMRSLYDVVRQAQEAALEAVRPGATVGEVDEAARSVLRRARLDKYFTHSTGHGVGLEIHELPRIARGEKQVLEPGMVITIEPGVYVPGRGGVRIEDMVAVTASGCEILTPATKDLITL
jgi:Xaa-Pro aminopeptidase